MSETAYDEPRPSEEAMRQIARQEIASLAALMLQGGTWGEALSDFSGRTGGGQEPGPEDEEELQPE